MVGVVLPAYGFQEMTDAVVADLLREPCSVLVVDNKGNYDAKSGEQVFRPGRNLGWALGCNVGMKLLFGQGCSAVALMNNDTRTSPGFVAGLEACEQEAYAGLVGPKLTNGAGKQCWRGTLEEFQPRRRYIPLPSLDGVCLYVPRATYAAVGGLDACSFGIWSWGAVFEYCHRVMARCRKLPFVSLLSLVHHIRSVTAKQVASELNRSYTRHAITASRVGRQKTIGRDYRGALSKVFWQCVQERKEWFATHAQVSGLPTF